MTLVVGNKLKAKQQAPFSMDEKFPKFFKINKLLNLKT